MSNCTIARCPEHGLVHSDTMRAYWWQPGDGCPLLAPDESTCGKPLTFEPFVSYDDEAVERAARAMYASDGGGDDSRWPSPTADVYRRRAEVALRAAGATDE